MGSPSLDYYNSLKKVVGEKRSSLLSLTLSNEEQNFYSIVTRTGDGTVFCDGSGFETLQSNI